MLTLLNAKRLQHSKLLYKGNYVKLGYPILYITFLELWLEVGLRSIQETNQYFF
ncbi:hypothetical protein SAMN05216167_113142 [Spirosoma endophyticum]|uniref:Uncharacterized protein n=1 Tax=Spirosoma endophyticum TaxID=662367 RepID=A0A1I2ADC6_9BACT|nr:hypothetical protein SAMN05216167_113142 [Spirosoma endophyticum]